MMADPFPTIDQKRCISCGVCVSICPDRILGLDSSSKAVVTGDRCMGCGHCYAVCPSEAVSIPGLIIPSFPETALESEAGSSKAAEKIDSLFQLMAARRSCRSFKSAAPNIKILEALARIGTTAPSGTNSQSWSFVILPQRADVIALGEQVACFYKTLNKKAAHPVYRLLSRLVVGNRLQRYYERYYETVERGLNEWYEEQRDRLFHGAPAAIIVAAESNASCPQEDALLATQNILLAAEALGVATCLIGFVVEAARREPSIAASLGFSTSEHIYSVIACGYSAVSFQRYAGRKGVVPRVVSLSESPEFIEQTTKGS